MKKYTIDQNGRSMIEMLGVLAIVGVLSVAGIAGYSKAMAKYKINKVMDQVSTIAANTKTLFASVGNYSGLSGNSRAFNLGLFPEDMTKLCATYSEGCLRNGMNGAVFIKGTTDSFTISMGGLTKEACTALFTSDWGGAAGFKAIKGGTAIASDVLAVPTAETPAANTGYTPADLASVGVYTAAKASCTAETGNAVTWVFY